MLAQITMGKDGMNSAIVICVRHLITSTVNFEEKKDLWCHMFANYSKLPSDISNIMRKTVT